jgi:uncharacterized protein (TIGR03085 family)
MPVPVDQREREALCELFLELGPEAPTLCEGWRTQELAAHLVLREHFHRWPDDKLAAQVAEGYEANVARLRAGAPLVPWRLSLLRALFNGFEYFVHHEDVRRANGMGRRADRPDLDRLASRTNGLNARRLARKVRPWRLELRPVGGEARSFGSGDGVALVGHPTELALYLVGRKQGVDVTVEGAPDAVAAVESAMIGL